MRKEKREREKWRLLLLLLLLLRRRQRWRRWQRCRRTAAEARAWSRPRVRTRAQKAASTRDGPARLAAAASTAGCAGCAIEKAKVGGLFASDHRLTPFSLSHLDPGCVADRTLKHDRIARTLRNAR